MFVALGKEFYMSLAALQKKNTKLHKSRSFPVRLRRKQFSEILLTAFGKAFLLTNVCCCVFFFKSLNRYGY